MNRNFEDKIILTSQNPEAFLVFSYDGSDGYIDTSIGALNNNIYVNGWRTEYLDDASTALILNSSTEIAPFHIFTDSKDDFEYNIIFNLYDDASLNNIIDTIDVSIINRPYLLDSKEFNPYETFNPLIDNEASYMLLKTNPKYSGNIKLVADPSNNFYLDTFKVSDLLTNKKYRKQKISGNSFLSGDIRKVFDSLPQGEIYKLGNSNILDISKPKTNYSDQYDTIYNYGARMLIDELYDEDFSILAPLWINSTIPDFFGLFRLDGTYNPNTYSGSDLNNLATKYINEGELIKSWNLKENSPLGKYLFNHLSELLDVQSPVNLSLNQYDPNTWNGIAIDKGIITGRSEVPYFFEKDSSNFTKINAFVSQGFERQNLLCPNLLNMEFIFNDKDVSMYSMNRYFGLYLTENQLYNFSYYSDTSTSDVRIISLDNKDVSTFTNSSIFDPSGNIEEEYLNRIFVLNDGVKLDRIKNTNQINNRENIFQYVNKLGENIFSTNVNKKDINTFITLKINNLLKTGEHLRIIDKTQNKIWEIYSIESYSLGAGEAAQYVTYNEPSLGYPHLYRTAFSTKGSINDQTIAIQKAFELFDNYEDSIFYIGFKKDDGLSIVIKNDYINNEILFQRITGDISYPIGDLNGNFNNASKPSDISFFGFLTPSVSDFNIIEADSSYGPIDFELYGKRKNLILPLINNSNYHTYSYDASITNLFTDNILYKASDGWNRLIKNFEVSTGFNYNSLYSEDPLSDNDKHIIITEKEIVTVDNIWYAYNVYPIYISLMGINPVKYFDYTIYDSSTLDYKSDYWYNRDNDASTYEFNIAGGQTLNIPIRNSFEIIEGTGIITIGDSTSNYDISGTTFKFNTFFNDASITASSNTRISYNYLSGSYSYTSYDSSKSEESIYSYYQDPLTKTKLKYGLTIPSISKWGLVGQDCRNNDARLLLSNSLFTNDNSLNSNFIPVYNEDSSISLYSNEISYPVFKYLDPGIKNWKDYIYYDINDVVDTSSGRKSILDLIFENPTYDIFSKLLYNSNSVIGKSTRSSILYYNIYEDMIISIIKGLKIGLKISSSGGENFSITNWNRYRFSFISSPSRNIKHNKPIEVIINENTRTVLMIWYQGNDNLNYNRRYNDYFNGKSALIDSNNTGDYNFSGFLTGDPSYSYIKSPFIVRNDIAENKIVNIYGNEVDYSTNICTPYAQLNYSNVSSLDSIFNAYSLTPGENNVVNSIFNFNDSFNSFNQKSIEYLYNANIGTYGRNISNIGYNYLNNENYYKDKTTDLGMLKDIIKDNNIFYNIIQEEEILTSLDFSVPPIQLTIFEPIQYKSVGSDSSIYVYNGGYRPLFKNILNFNDNESPEIINITEKDFIFSNTDLRSYDNIDQYWYNKVVNTVSVSDSSNNINYIKDFNPFKSLWDANYYILSNNNVDEYIDGYNNEEELSSFFGSKLVLLPEQLILDVWKPNNAKVIIREDYYSLEYNLTKTIIDMFNNNNNFLKNWSGLENVSNDIINRYIIKTILKNYNISINKILVELYQKNYDGNILYRENDGSFINKANNIESNLTFENDQYIYKIRVNKSNVKSYYTKIIFNKK